MSAENIFQSVSKLSCSNSGQGAKTSRFIEGELSSDELEPFLQHLDKCEKCSKLVFLSEYFDKCVETELAANGG
jgi:hypothetical protein